jgi:putative peptide zinc metalloprotease protein
MGIMILVLNPWLYVNVSDSWLLPNKWHRIAIGAAGICVECTLAAFCTFVWWFSEPGLLHYLALNIMFISSVSTILFNSNPLLRFDGYYILADYLEIPNLRAKAQKIFTQKCSQWFLGMEKQEDPFTPQKNQIWFALFSIASFFYRWVLMASILTFLYLLFKRYEITIIAQIIVAMSLFSLFVMPIIKLVKFFWVPGRIYKVKKKNFYATLALIATLLGLFMFYPLSYTVVAPVIIELRTTTSQQVFGPDARWGSRLREVRVKPGNFVQAGEVIAVLDSPKLQMEFVDAEGRYNEYVQQLKTVVALQQHDPRAALRIPELTESLEKEGKLLENKQHDVEMLTLRAPIAGIVVSPPWRRYQSPSDDQLPHWWGTPLEPLNVNVTLEPGTVVCSVGDPALLEANVIVDQSKISFVHPNQRVELKLHEFPDQTFYGVIDEIEKQSIASLEVQLSTRAGGEIPTTTKADGVEEPTHTSYRVRVYIDNNSDLSIRVGMTGLGKIHVKPQTLGYRLWRFLGETFNFRL